MVLNKNKATIIITNIISINHNTGWFMIPCFMICNCLENSFFERMSVGVVVVGFLYMLFVIICINVLTTQMSKSSVKNILKFPLSNCWYKKKVYMTNKKEHQQIFIQ